MSFQPDSLRVRECARACVRGTFCSWIPCRYQAGRWSTTRETGPGMENRLDIQLTLEELEELMSVFEGVGARVYLSRARALSLLPPP